MKDRTVRRRRSLYERLTGTPWTTVRSATAEFGPPPGAVYQEQIAGYTNYQLVCMDRDELLARLRADGARPATALRHPITDNYRLTYPYARRAVR